MKDVYSQASCCIAATAAKDSNTGLFFDRDTIFLKPLRLETTKARMLWRRTNQTMNFYLGSIKLILIKEAIDTAPLNQRAWVAQERYLSNGTIHFTKELVFWECSECTASEQDPKGARVSGGYVEQYSSHHTTLLKKLVQDYGTQHYESSKNTAEDDLRQIYKFWHRFRSTYSGLHLTKDEDILVALSGVAQDVAGTINDTLVAGMWRNRLIEELCWVRHSDDDDLRLKDDKSSRPPKWRAPTWSWASVKGPLACCDYDILDPTCVEDMAVVEGLAVDQKPSGEVIDASLKLRCRLIHTKSPESASESWELPSGVRVTLDDAIDSRLGYVTRDVSLVTLRYCPIFSVEKVQGILVSPSRAKTGSFERVGHFRLQLEASPADKNEDRSVVCSRISELLRIHDDTEETTIELI